MSDDLVAKIIKFRTVYPTAVRNEPITFKLVHEVLERAVDNVIELAFKESFDNPETVPIILFAKTSSRYDECMIKWDKTTFARDAVTKR